jgi:hypothetical protein
VAPGEPDATDYGNAGSWVRCRRLDQVALTGGAEGESGTTWGETLGVVTGGVSDTVRDAPRVLGEALSGALGGLAGGLARNPLALVVLGGAVLLVVLVARRGAGR